jgi:hypothetical protein
MKAVVAVALSIIGIGAAALAAASFAGFDLAEFSARPAAMIDKGTFDPRLPLFF